MAPLAHLTSSPGVQVSKATLHSPPRSPRRPTKSILKDKNAIMNESISPRKIAKQERYSVLNEVRESLTMPSCGTDCDDESEVWDTDGDVGEKLTITGIRLRGSSQNVNAIVSKSQHHSKPISIHASRSEHQEQAPEHRQTFTRKGIDRDDQSIGAASTKSTKSTRSIRSFFSQRKSSSPTKATTTTTRTTTTARDDVSIAASTSTKSSWWKRSSKTPEVVPKRSTLKATKKAPEATSAADTSTGNGRSGLRSFQSFRVKKPEKVNVRGVVKNNDQLVADFFDVQSFASEPDFVGSPRLRKTVLNAPPEQSNGGFAKKKNRVLETSSVVSGRSQQSNVFSRFFQRMRAINDEVLDINDDYEDVTPDLTGTGILLNGDENGSLVDDELTLCSGFDSYSQIGSVQDDDDYDDDDASTESNVSNSNGSNEEDKALHPVRIALSSNEEIETTSGTPFLQKIMERRKLKNESTILRDVLGQGSITNTGVENVVSPISEKVTLSRQGNFVGSPQQQRLVSPLVRQKSLSPSKNFESPLQRSKALAQSGMKLLSSKSMSHLPSSIEAEDTESPRITRGLCRWNSDLSLNSDPSAPKRPTRRGTQVESPMQGQLSTPSPSTRLSPKKGLDKLIKTSQSMRNLNSQPEGGSNEDEDDDSILSLLSGLLATWSTERDGINVTITQRVSAVRDGVQPKSILKVPSHESEEQKVDPRERYPVRFKTIEVREYERIVGDNPSCSKGPPISIGWEYTLRPHYPINDYEHLVRGPRRTKKEFHLSADRRTHLLVNEWNCSEDDIRKARREATYIQYCRAKTAFSGSRAAAKEAAFLRKANDRCKVQVESKPIMPTSNDDSLPKVPSRRRAIEISPPPLTNRPIQPSPVKALSSSVRQRLLEV